MRLTNITFNELERELAPNALWAGKTLTVAYLSEMLDVVEGFPLADVRFAVASWLRSRHQHDPAELIQVDWMRSRLRQQQEFRTAHKQNYEGRDAAEDCAP